MVPHSWNMLRDDNVPQLFFFVYGECCKNNWVDSADMCLQNLVLLASLRRSFFQKDDLRMNNLSGLIQGTTFILTNKPTLLPPACAHSFCRLLGKINTAHQISELSGNDGFKSWIDLIYQYTVEQLSGQGSGHNSQHYLLSFWAQMVAPIIVLKDGAPPQLEEHIQIVAISYIDSRIRLAELSASGDIEDDPLEDEVLRAEQLDVVAQLGRCKYANTARHLLDKFMETQQAGQGGQIPQNVFEKKQRPKLIF
jgi:exportin-7